MRHWIFWQRQVSIHQAPLMAALARCEGERVHVVCEAGLDPGRRALGWSMPDYSPAGLYVAPTPRELAAVLAIANGGEVIHVFSGPRTVPRLRPARERLIASGAVLGLYAESGRFDCALAGALRRLFHRFLVHRWRRRCGLVLGIGAKGVAWWRGCGFSPERIYEFGYFVDPPAAALRSIATRSDGAVRLVFVGTLAAHKGVDLLLRALAQCGSGQWRLEVVGGGAAMNTYRVMAERLGLTERIDWLGVLPNEAVRGHLSGADALVLPSRWDGWGVVVNEALQAGVPAIVSDAVGAACLISDPVLGRVFPTGSVTALARTLGATITAGPVSEAQRAAILNWAHEALAPQVAAGYLVRIAEHALGRGDRPLPPWSPESVLRARDRGVVAGLEATREYVRPSGCPRLKG